MPDSTTLTIAAQGHVCQLVVTRDTGSFVNPVLDTSADVRFNLDAGGSFPRTIYALLADASYQGLSQSVNPNDTATWLIPLSGETPGEDGGNPEFRDVYSGETVEVGITISSGLVSEGAYESLGVASGFGLTNKSGVSKPPPVVQNITEPGQKVTGDSFTVRGLVEAGEGVSSVTAVITDSGLTEHTVAMSRVKYPAPVDWYPELEPGVAAVSAWEGTVDISGAADGSALVSIRSEGVNGQTYDSNTAGQLDIGLYIDRAGGLTDYTAYVDESFTMNITGTFSLSQDEVIEGGTSGVRAIAEAAATGSGGSTTVTLTRITDPSTPWTVGETLTGFTSGSATVDDGVETENASSSPALGDPNNPYNGSGIASKAFTDQRVADGDAREAGGCVINIQSRHCTRFGRTQGGFGWPAPAAALGAMTIQSESGDRDSCFMHGGGETVSRDNPFFLCKLKNLTVKILGTASEDQFWGFSTGDDPLLLLENVRLIGLGPNATMPTVFANLDGAWHHQVLVEDWDATISNNATASDRTGVWLWMTICGKESDGLQVNGGGNNTFIGRTYDLRGSASGNHGDVVQFIGECDNNYVAVYADECSYQGVFSNNSTGTDLLKNTYVRTFTKQVNDGDIGSLALSFNQSVRNLIVEQSTVITATVTVLGQPPKNGSFNIISETGRSDSVWVRNSVFQGWGPQLWNEDGNANAPWGASCAVNCHTIDGTARGVRGTSGGTLADLFVGPWTNGGESPGNDDTSWAPKSNGLLTGRLLSRDQVGQVYGFVTGDAFSFDGSGDIGAMQSPNDVKEDRGLARLMMLGLFKKKIGSV